MNRDDSDSKPSPPSYEDACPSFHLFNKLPFELRAKIWEAALRPRIVRWVRTEYRGGSLRFPSKSLPLMSVSKEAREAAFMYGGYQNLTDDRHPVYFSPKLDYFWFDPGITEVLFPYPDALKELIPKLGELQNIMVHPNWHPFRTPRKHEALFEVPSIRQVLVVVDETRISPHIEELLETVKEFKSYYAALQKQEEATKTPYIAAGCLGWIGEAPKRVQRGNEGNRQLVAVFEEKWEIYSHIHRLKQEEVQVTRSLR